MLTRSLLQQISEDMSCYKSSGTKFCLKFYKFYDLLLYYKPCENGMVQYDSYKLEVQYPK